MDSFGTSHLGKVRSNNEDLFVLIPERAFFALADGMGGHNAGEVAAAKAIETLSQHIRQMPSFANTEEVSQCLLYAIQDANRTIQKSASTDRSLTGMGTTLSSYVIYENDLIYAHVGDSRLYRFRPNAPSPLQQLSKDHSLRAILIEESDIDPILLDQPGFKNVITRALGTQSYVMPDIGIIPIQEGDLYLLCSDGLSDLVSDAEISHCLSLGGELPKLCQNLVDAALKKGGTDNITVVLTKIAARLDRN